VKIDFIDIYNKRPIETIAIVIFVLIFIVWLFYKAACPIPNDFPTDSLFVVEKGETLQGVAKNLESKHYVCSSFWFSNLVIFFSTDRGVKAGDYYFGDKEGVFSVAYRLTNSDFKIPTRMITVPEGFNNREIADLLKTKLPKFDFRMFLVKTEKLEGYLFPDTYSFPENAVENDVISIMNSTFGEKIKILNNDISKFGRSLRDVVIMSSLVEEEVRTYKTRQIVAGILWKRLSLGMPLQVDAVFHYIKGKDVKVVSLDDLKIDSPYNTYLHKGLPPGAIGNPGLDAIRATVNPVKTSYLYYLTDKDGNMHYARTYAEHLANKENYLK